MTQSPQYEAPKMRPKDVELDLMRSLLVDLMIALRSQAHGEGASPLKTWDQLESRMLAAARTSSGWMEWPTKVKSGLKLAAPRKETSSAILALVQHLDAMGSVGMITPTEFLQRVETEVALLIAMARDRTEKNRSDRARD